MLPDARPIWPAALWTLLATSCLAQVSATAPPVRFEDVAKQAGLTALHISSPEKRYIIESMSGGPGFIDCDGDGKLDIVTVNGSSVDRYRQGGDLMVTLYHQDSDLKFTDITAAAGLTRKGWGMGVSVADYDNDGRPDFYVTGYGGNVLYHNLGKCKFEDVTDKAGVRVGGFSTGAAWGDFDRDGKVDLFVPRYVHVEIDKLPEFGSTEFCEYRGIKVQCGPKGMPGESDLLFRNRGDGTFEDVSRKAGVDDPPHYLGMQGIWGDYDNDGWPDLYVTNDSTPSYLYHNKRDGTFEEVGLVSGVSLNIEGAERAAMGVDFGDIDHDGLLDIVVTNFALQFYALYWNQGEKGFTDIGGPSGVAQASSPYVGWGTALFDMDNDGWLDIFASNGHVYPQMDIKGGEQYLEQVLLLRNQRNRKFDDITALTGLDKLPLASHRGAAFGDVNNDGKVDILVVDVDGPPLLLINRTDNAGHAALFKLVGTESNKAAIGTRVKVTAGELVQFSEVRGGSSYLSQNDLRLHFGLGKETAMNTVEVSWPSGKKEVFKDLPADFLYTITEGKGSPQKTPFSGATSQEQTPTDKKSRKK